MLSFGPSEEQQLIQSTARDFAGAQMRPNALAADEENALAPGFLERAWELGLAVGAIPEAHGGAGMPRSAVTGALICEELAFGDLAHALAMLAPALVAYPIVDYGTAAQKEKLLPAFTGSAVPRATAAVVEPTMDWDPAAMTVTAERRGGDYVLTGRKCFVPLGSSAEMYLVYAAEGGAGLDRVQGFLIPRSAKGMSVGEKEKNMGIRGLDTVELELDGVSVAADARLGGEAGCNFEKITSYSRVALAAMAVGVARAAFEHSRDYAKERKAFGEPIAAKQAIAFMIAEMAIEIDSARLLVWEAAWRLDRGEIATKESYLAKLYADTMALKVTDNAVQAMGGHGYIRENPVEGWLRHARGFPMFDGLTTV
jgi:acyl-CoA dehydrogenase